MPKLTRKLVREIEIAKQRVEVVLDKQGIRLRGVDSGRHEVKLSWEAFLCVMTGQMHPTDEPTCDDVQSALKCLEEGKMNPKDDIQTKPAKPLGSLPSLDQILKRLDQWLRNNRQRYHEALLPGATDSELNTLRKELSCDVPDELETLLRWHNGQNPEVFGSFEGRWLLMGTQHILDTLDDLSRDPLPGWQASWIPFLDNDAFSYLFLDGKEERPPVGSYWDGLDEQPIEAPSLTAWMYEFVTAVERGEYIEDPERGEFLKKM